MKQPQVLKGYACSFNFYETEKAFECGPDDMSAVQGSDKSNTEKGSFSPKVGHGMINFLSVTT